MSPGLYYVARLLARMCTAIYCVAIKNKVFFPADTIAINMFLTILIANRIKGVKIETHLNKYVFTLMGKKTRVENV